MILHIPHSGTDTLGVDIDQRDINRGTDWFTDELFSHQNTDRVQQKHSRFIVDCERLPDDIEPMLKDGYGIQYTKDFDGKLLNVALPPKEKVQEIYDNHHKELNFLTRRILCYIPVVFIVDCHSFGDEQKLSDVDVCLGFNDDFTTYSLIEKLKNYLEDNNLKVGINDPYSNAIVPNQFYGNKNVKSIMVEVNKRLYLTEDFQKNEDFNKTQKIINNVLEIISKEEESYN